MLICKHKTLSKEGIHDGHTVDSEGLTLLHKASQHGYYNAVRDLLQYGVHPHVLTYYDGLTPIEVAKQAQLPSGGHSPETILADHVRFEQNRAKVIHHLEEHKCHKVSYYLKF